MGSSEGDISEDEGSLTVVTWKKFWQNLRERIQLTTTIES